MLCFKTFQNVLKHFKNFQKVFQKVFEKVELQKVAFWGHGYNTYL